MRTRSYCANFEMNLGAISTTGRLLGIRRTEDKMNLCTADGSPVTQVYLGPDGTVYANKDMLHRGIKVKGEDKLNVIGSAEDFAAVRTSQLPLNKIEFTMHATEEVDKWLFPSDNQGYLFQPRVLNKKAVDPHSMKNYAAILAFMQHPHITLVGKCNLVHHEGLFRAGLHRGHLYIQKQLYPEGLNEWDLDDVTIDERIAETAEKVLSSVQRSFDPTSYENEVNKRIAMLAAGTLDQSDQAQEDVMAALLSMMEV